jgi:superfamily I DNA/RNA helicase
MLNEYSGLYTNIPLRVNCRNTRQIGEETALLSGFDSLPYRLDHAEGLPVDYRYWKTKEEELQQLESSLLKLLNEGIIPEDIVVLGPARYENSSASMLGNVNRIQVSDLGDISGEPGSCIIFSTIHSFKGMESPVIILCGISSIDGDEERALLYVGMSRARSHLIIVASEKLKKALPELTRKRLSEGWAT